MTEQPSADSRSSRKSSRLTRVVWHLSTRPWLNLYLVYHFLKAWLRSRRAGDLVAGFPAILVVAVVVYVVIWTNPRETASQYQSAAIQAFRAEDYERADLFFRRLVHMEPARASHRLQLALCAERQQEPRRARQLMRQIVEEQRQERTRAQAHLWLAVDLAKNRSLADPQTASGIQQHLQATLRLQPNRDDARTLLAKHYVTVRRFTDAAEIIQQKRTRTFRDYVDLTRLYKATGQTDAAERAARTVSEKCQQQLESDPENVVLYQALAESQLHRGQYAESIATLVKAVEACGLESHQGLHKNLALAHIAWFKSLPKEARQGRLELLNEAMRHGPNQPGVLIEMASLISELGKDPAKLTPIRDALASGHAPAALHFILGVALVPSDPERSRSHFEQAMEHHPNAPSVLNNLAWMMAKAEEPDLERAEKLVSEALALAPKHPYIRDTRGHIRAARGDAKGAIADLEFALHHDLKRQETLELIAELYDQRGLNELAAATRQQLQQLLTENKPAL